MQIAANLVEGRLLPRPSLCPQSVFGIMTRCWSRQPDERPRFAAIINALNKVLLLFIFCKIARYFESLIHKDSLPCYWSYLYDSRPVYLEQSAGQCDFNTYSVYFSSATENLSVLSLFPWHFSGPIGLTSPTVVPEVTIPKIFHRLIDSFNIKPVLAHSADTASSAWCGLCIS